MSQEEKPVWSFKSKEKKSRSEEEEEKKTLDFEIPTWVEKNARTIVGMALVVIAGFVLIPFLGTGQAQEPQVDIPGGEIKKLSEGDVENWLRVMEFAVTRFQERTQQNQEKEGETKKIAVHSSTLLSFCSELENREELKKEFEMFCDKQEISFAEFHEISHEIGLANPFGSYKQENGTGTNRKASERVKNFQNNRQLVEQHREDIQNIWYRFQQVSSNKSTVTETSGGNNEG